MINYKKIESHVLRMVRNNSTPRLRKWEWTDGNIFKSMEKLNAFFKGKRITHKGDVFYNFAIEQREGKVVGAERPYYYQIITCDRIISWEKGYDEVVKTTEEMF